MVGRRDMIGMRILWIGLMVMLASAAGGAGAPETLGPGVQLGGLFGGTSPLAANDEIARRLLSPLAALKVRSSLAKRGLQLGGQSIDPAKESFAVSVPTAQPKDGYGLLVFVPPWEDARLPYGWKAVFERRGFIIVSAGNSGNTAEMLGRRAPLALTAVADLERRLPINPARVFIAGFSGGSRVALRIAVAYPDVFRGAILNAGSDPIGDDIVLPERSLFREFQSRSRIVFVTGQADEINIQKDEASRVSLLNWCVENFEVQTMFLKGHDLASSAAVERALDALLKPRGSTSSKVAACQARIDEGLSHQLEAARQRLAAGDKTGTRRLLEQIDRRYGGLAAPDSADLYSRATD